MAEIFEGVSSNTNGDAPYLVGGVPNGETIAEHYGWNKQGKINNDSEDDAIEKLAKELNVKLDDSTKDYLWQYYLNERSRKAAYKDSLDADINRYPRLVEGLRKAGLNPFLALSSVSAGSVDSNGFSINGDNIAAKKRQNSENQTNIGKGILTLIGIIAAAVIAAL